MNEIKEHPRLGHEYLILRDSECVGRATYVEDPNHGLCFREERDGEYVVYMDFDQAVPVNE